MVTTQERLNEFHSRIQDIDALEDRLHRRASRARRRLLLREHQHPTMRLSHLRLWVSHSYTPELTKSGAMAALMQGRDVKPSPAVWKLYIEGKLLVGFLDGKNKTEEGSSPPQDDETALDRKAKPLQTTHMFDKVTVSFQTIFETITAGKSPPAKKKKSRRNTVGGKAATPQKQDTTQQIASATQRLAYSPKDQPPADMWTFEYVEPALPEPANKWKVGSVVAHVELFRRYRYPGPQETNLQLAAAELRYRIMSLPMQKALFPLHGPETVDMLTGKKRDFSSLQRSEIPSHNEVHIPCTLTMSEITNAFFTYIRDRRLVSEQDKTVIQADKLLRDILGMEQFSFSQLQQLLLTKRLIVPAGGDSEDPIRITYLMDIATGCVLGEPNNENVIQLDCDIYVPSLWGVRLRELLRLAKQREVDYATARLQIAKTGRGTLTPTALTQRSIPLHLALASVAKGDAKTEAQIDARISYLLGQLKERIPQTIRARQLCDELKKKVARGSSAEMDVD